MKKKNIVIVGGGVVGILAALIESNKGHKVTIVERDRKLGGLLGSFSLDGAWYDYGTHVPGVFQNESLNDLLYGPSTKHSQTPKREHQLERHERFLSLPFLRSENFFHGAWNTESPLPTLFHFSEHIIKKAQEEILQTEFDRDEKNLGRFVQKNFGRTVGDYVYSPIMKKLQGEALDNLHVETLRTFGLQRVISFSAEETLTYKKIPKYDHVIGYHSYEMGSPSLPYLYPKSSKGIGAWIDFLEEKLMANHVEIKTSMEIHGIHKNQRDITALHIRSRDQHTDSMTLECDHVIWTVPAPFLLKELPNKPLLDQFKFRTTTLVNFQFKEPLLKSRPQYLLNWDPNYFSYRITLYPNIKAHAGVDSVNNLTVEVLGDESYQHRQDELKIKVLEEMSQLGIVSKNNPCIHGSTMYLGPTFPVMTPAFFEQTKTLNALLVDEYPNVHFLGRGSGKAFFIGDLLLQCFQELHS